MSRVPTLATHSLMTSRLIGTQAKMFNLQIQLSTEKKSQAYSGISNDALRLVNFENERTRSETYITTNTVARTKLEAMNTSITGVVDSLKVFRNDLNDITSYDYDPMDSEEVSNFKAFQQRAFNIMKDLESYLDIKVGGEYLFAGGRTNVAPVVVPYASVEEFQAVYDGNTVTAPESRHAHMNNTMLTSTDTGDLDFDPAGTITATTAQAFNSQYYNNAATGDVSFDNTNNQIQATTAGVFSNVEAGMMIKVAGSSADNDKFYTVDTVSPDGRTLTVVPNITDAVPASTTTQISVPSIQPGPMTVSGSNNNNRTVTVTDISSDGRTLTVTPAPTNETLTAPSNVQISNDIYYKGGETVVEHRVSDTQTIQFGVNAKDGAIEKAFRSLGMVVQGIPTDGSGDIDGPELKRRLDDALKVVNDAINHNIGDRTESSDDFLRLENMVASNQVVLNRAVSDQKTYSSFLANRITDMENVDKTEVATRINDERNALQVSYAAFSMINQLSLVNFMT